MDAATLVGRIPVSPLAQGEASNVVEVRGVDKNYKRTAALRDIHMEVGHGEVFGLIGPDGSGKSSLIRAIAGVQQYDAGIITLFGTRIDSERSAQRVKSRIGLMPQGLGNNLYPELSIDDHPMGDDGSHGEGGDEPDEGGASAETDELVGAGVGPGGEEGE